MDHSGDCHAIFDFFIDDAVAADHNRAGLLDPLRPAFHDLAEDLDIHLALGKGDDVQRRFGLCSHRIDIAQRIGRGDLAEDVGVIHNGGEKINRIDDGQIRPKTIHSCVVGGLSPDNDIRMIKLGKAVQHLHQVGRAELGGSTCSRDLLRQANRFSFHKSHGQTFIFPAFPLRPGFSAAARLRS